ncbi:GLPGLI family protein [Chryseobacterium echinoideorum]|uniref:GLPGLI family protein n=1 Tax=Chryseobacterium echinoideorum TaxID=1549648 RepID=UPI0011864FDB|nr:GLPGLI family protein [Chryseobacterium echinoideorum]
MKNINFHTDYRFIYIFEKIIHDYESVLKTNIGSTRIVLRNEKLLNWKISSEKDEILGYKVQKATAFWRGRNWIAWFTQEIPLQDGPYEFSGLPGLILKIEDSKADHSFTLIASKRSSSENEVDLSIKQKEIEVSEEKFRKLWSDYKKDPVKDMRQMMNSPAGNIVATITFDGKTYSNDEMLKASEKISKEEIEKNNNFIELDLYK